MKLFSFGAKAAPALRNSIDLTAIRPMTMPTEFKGPTPRLALGIDHLETHSLVNAKGFATLSSLAYETPATINDTLVELGATGVQFFEKKNSQAYIAHTPDRIVVAFRGTEPKVAGDWAHDFAIGQKPHLTGEAHRGYTKALASIWPEMVDALKGHLAEKKRPVFITGHSMGAGMATLAAIDLALTEKITPRGVFAYNSPPVMDAMLASTYASVLGRNTLRFVNQADVVTRLNIPGFQHVGLEYLLAGKGEVIPEANNWTLFKVGASRFIRNPLSPISDHRLDPTLRSLEMVDANSPISLDRHVSQAPLVDRAFQAANTNGGLITVEELNDVLRSATFTDAVTGEKGVTPAAAKALREIRVWEEERFQPEALQAFDAFLRQNVPAPAVSSEKLR